MSAQPAPKDPPFKVGTRVRYLGDRQSGFRALNGTNVWTLYPGVEVTIEKAHVGRRGSGQQLRDEDGPMFDDDGDAIMDHTRDGRSVWYFDDDKGNHQGRAIWPDDAHEWEIVR